MRIFLLLLMLCGFQAFAEQLPSVTDLTKHTDVILKKSYEVMHGELGNADSILSWSNA